MFFSYFGTVDVDAFANSLAGEFFRSIPSESIENEVRGYKRRLEEATDVLLLRVEKFAQNNKLNMFKRARLGNTLRWKMVESGYTKAVVEPIVLDVVKRLTLIKKKTG